MPTARLLLGTCVLDGKIMAPMSLFTGLIDDVRIYNSAVRP